MNTISNKGLLCTDVPSFGAWSGVWNVWNGVWTPQDFEWAKEAANCHPH